MRTDIYLGVKRGRSTDSKIVSSYLLRPRTMLPLSRLGSTDRSEWQGGTHRRTLGLLNALPDALVPRGVIVRAGPSGLPG
jgi:hypothetical protein